MGKRERAAGAIAYAMLMMLAADPSRAGAVESRLPSGLVAAAEYRPGRGDYPSLLFLHGFLQTRNSPPMNRLAESLADAGYPVLVPTLSLNVSRRAKSLPCEAVHLHAQQDDVNEIAHWVDWLAGRADRGVVLVGHSSGGKDVLAYLLGKPGPKIKKAIFISIGPVYVDAAELHRARSAKAPNPGKAGPLQRFTMGYCKGNYVTPAPAYVSYAAWTGERIVEGLNRLTVPADIVLGSSDQVFEPGWAEQLKTSKVPVTTVGGAGHFFDGEYEFALHDRVNAILGQLRK